MLRKLNEKGFDRLDCEVSFETASQTLIRDESEYSVLHQSLRLTKRQKVILDCHERSRVLRVSTASRVFRGVDPLDRNDRQKPRRTIMLICERHSQS